MTLSLPMLKHCFPGPRVRDSGGTRTRTRSGRVVPVSGLAGAVGDRPRRPLQVAAPAARPQGATAPRAGTAPLCWRWAAGAGGPSGTEGVPVVDPPRVPAGPPLPLCTQPLGTEQWGRVPFLLTQQTPRCSSVQKIQCGFGSAVTG